MTEESVGRIRLVAQIVVLSVPLLLILTAILSPGALPGEAVVGICALLVPAARFAFKAKA